MAEDNEVKKDLIEKLLHQQGLSKQWSTGKHIHYRDLLEGRVRVDLVIRLERKNDIHTVANKTFDFSSRTIRHLIKEGYEETNDQLIN